MENDIVRVKVLGLGAALKAGFVPDGQTLKNPKTGASIEQAVLTDNAGQVVKGISTGDDKHPVVIDGVIFNAALVSLEVQEQAYKKACGTKRELVRFDDGTLAVDCLDGTYEVLEVETLAGVHKDGKSHKVTE